MKKSRTPSRIDSSTSLSTDSLTRVTGGARHAEKNAACTASTELVKSVDVGWFGTVYYSVPGC